MNAIYIYIDIFCGIDCMQIKMMDCIQITMQWLDIYIYKGYNEANLKYIMGRCQKLHGSRRGDGATNFKK